MPTTKQRILRTVSFVSIVLLTINALQINGQAQTSTTSQSRNSAEASEAGQRPNRQNIDRKGDLPNFERGRSSSLAFKNYFDLGVKKALAGRSAEAIEAFKQAILLNPTGGDAYFSLGNVYADLGRWNEAARSYHEAIRCNQRDGEAYNKLGVVYLSLGLYGQAAEAFLQAIRIYPAWAEPHYNLGGAYHKLGKEQAATASYRQAIRLRPDYAARLSPVASVVPTTILPEGSKVAESMNTAIAVSSPAPKVSVKSETQPKADSSSTTTAAEDLTRVYRVGAGDVLDIHLLNTPTNQTTLYTVSEAGLLDYPLLREPLAVAGMTTDQIDARLTSELRRLGVDEHPRVAVSVHDYASHTIMVSGLVSDPGTKILIREGVPLYVVLADARPRPDAEQAIIKSHTAGRTAIVDLNDQEAMNMLVRPADVVIVRKRPPEFYYIGGAVREPGEKTFHSGITLTQAILAAGGVSRSSTKIVKVSRAGANGLLVVTGYNLKDINSGKLPEPVLQPGDRIEVEPYR